MLPHFSIIVPTYNREVLLEKCVKSIINQRFENWELIIIDDGSTDNTERIISEFKEPRIKYLYKQHGERSAARNEGLRHMRSPYVCFVDDDDFLEPSYLQDFYSAQNSGHSNSILRTKYRIHKINGTQLGPVYSKKTHKNPLLFSLYNMCGLWTLCFPMSLIKNLTFPCQFPHWQDTYFILLALQRGTLIQLNQVNYNYRIHSSMGSFLVKNESQLRKRAHINVEAMTHFFELHYSKISNHVNKAVFDFIRAEKFLQYSVLAKKHNYKSLSKELFRQSWSLSKNVKWWKYYLQYFT